MFCMSFLMRKQRDSYANDELRQRTLRQKISTLFLLSYKFLGKGIYNKVYNQCYDQKIDKSANEFPIENTID